VSNHVALLAAWIAMCGSLFFSEVLGWLPCELCWYQRIFMYPLAFILAIGILRRDRGLYMYVLPLSLFGGLISLYHYLLIKTTLFPPPECKAGVSCTVDYLNWFGFINIPFMALTAFLIISVMMIVSALRQQQEDEILVEDVAEDDEAPATPGFGMADIAVFVIIAVVLIGFIVGSRFVA
jgi:disulfide bond formation protein DsbB